MSVGSVWAYVATQDGKEGVIQCKIGDQDVLMFASDETRRDELWPIAQSLATTAGVTVTLIEYTAERVVHEFPGRRSQE